MTLPLVSIAIPAYKKKFLGQAIESALHQTYSHIEIIIVNDRSPEDLPSVVNRYEDKRIRCYVNEKNLGKENPALNWNRCLSYARGEFFALLCDDDMYAPNFIEEMLSLARKHPQTHVFRSRADIIDGQGRVTDWYPNSPEWETASDYMWHVFKRCRKQTISEFMYRTARLRECQGYAMLPLAWHADYLSVYTFALDGGIASSGKILMHFRQSGFNISSQNQLHIMVKLSASKLYMDEVRRLASEFPDMQEQAIITMMYDYIKTDTRWMLNQARKRDVLSICCHPRTHGIPFITTPSLLWHALWHKRK